MDEAQGQQVEPHGIARRMWGFELLIETPKHSEGVVAVMLERTETRVGEVVEGRVIVRNAMNESEIHALKPVCPIACEVRVVGQGFVHGVKQRRAGGPWKALGHGSSY